MSRRSLTLLIASVGTAVAIAISVLVPVPYVILGPGPTLNTLGKDSSGHPLITISGHASYPVSGDRKSTRLNSSHVSISYAVFCLKKKKNNIVSPINLTQSYSTHWNDIQSPPLPHPLHPPTPPTSLFHHQPRIYHLATPPQCPSIT